MRNVPLTVIAAIAAITATIAPSLVARAQTAPRFEYLRVVPYRADTSTPERLIQRWGGYRACLAASNEWTCREFEHTNVPNGALRTMLATLGNEGWELVSTPDEKHELNGSFGGLTYLFKRQRQ